MKQFYALLLLLFTFTGASGNPLGLSNSAENPCAAFAGYTVSISIVDGISRCKNPYSGELRATLRDANGNAVTTGVQYAWYYADNMFNNQYRVSTGRIAKDLAPGTYNVVITHNQTDCQFFGSPTTINKQEQPFFTVTDVGVILTCNADPLGYIRISNPKGYKIQWNAGYTVGDHTQLPKYQNKVVLDDIPPGVYTIVAIDEDSGCESDPFTMVVDGYPVTPVVSAVITPNTNCSGPGNGSITLTARTPAPGTEPPSYRYEWRRGDANGPVLSQYTTAIATGLQAGTYTIKVTGNYTNTAMECSTWATYVVPNQLTVPTATFTSTPNTVCNTATAAAGTTYTGTITGSATFNGQAVTNYTNYTFTWTDANGATGSVTGTNIIPRLNGGTYTVVARDNSIGCNANPVNVTVLNQQPTQSLSLAPTAQTNCNGTPNGSITATYGISPASTSTYRLDWFAGTNTSGNPITTNLNTTTNTASNLAGGQSYTVRATDLASGCQITRTIMVPLQQGVVTVSATATPNGICAPATGVNGSISITEVRLNNTVVTDLTGYTFAWYKQNSGGTYTLISGQTANTLSGQAAGSYQVIATNSSLQCPSTPTTVTIIDQLPSLALSLTPIAQTNCAGTPNGSITASFSKQGTTQTTGYSLKWYRGTTVNAANEFTTGVSGNIASALAGAQSYTVEATDAASGCKTVTTVMVPMQMGVVTVQATPTPNGICAPATAVNGSISVSQLRFNNTIVTDFTGYTFAWAKQTTTGTYTAISGTSATISGLAAGTYRLIATKTDVQCASNPITITVTDQLPTLALSLTPVAQTNCAGTPNGSITASFSKQGTTQTTGYSLKWYRGTTVNAANEFTTGVSGNIASALAGAQSYTVEATDAASGCKTVTTVMVPLTPAVISATATPTDNRICAPATAVNGSITVNTVVFNGTSSTTLTGYTFAWYKQNTAGTYVQISGQTGTTLSGQAAGMYQLRATRTDLQCTSDPITVEIKDVLPVLSFELNPTPQTSCTGAAPNGELVVANYSLSPASATSTPTYTWYIGTGTTTALPAGNIAAGSNGTRAIGLTGGTSYTVVATDAASGCSVSRSMVVPIAQPTIVLTPTVTDNSICDPTRKNGAINVTVQYNGATAPTSDYTYEWFVEGSATAIAGVSGPALTGRAAGRYTVRAQHNLLKCYSNPITVEIKDVLPVLSFELTTTPQTSCTGAAPNGELVVANYSLSPASATSTPTYTWYIGTGTTTALPAGNIAAGSNGTRAIGLTGGTTYTVVATDAASGCSVSRSMVVPIAQPTIVLTPTVTDNSICDPTRKNGAINVTVQYNGATAPTSDYTYEWFVEGSATAIAGVSGPALTGRAAGRYTVRAQHNLLKCYSNPITVEIKDVLPVLSFELTTTPQTSCTGAAPNGELVVANYSLSPASATSTPTYTWYIGTGTTTALPAGNIAAGSNGTRAIGLTGGTTYTVVATDAASGCSVSRSMVVPIAQPTIVLTPTVTDNSICDPTRKNGAINVTVQYNGATAPTSDYTYEWFVEGSATAIAGVSGPALTGRAAGRYTVRAQHNLLKCYSNPITVEIKDVLPVLSFELNPTPQTSCTGAAPNGELVVANYSLSPASATSTPTYTWYIGTGTTTALPAGNIAAGSNGTRAIGLTGGTTYTVVATDAASGCSVSRSMVVPIAQPTIVLTPTVTDNSICDPTRKNGAINVTVQYNGATAPTSDYTYEWFVEGSATAIAGVSGPALTGRAAGRYTVRAQHNLLKCYSDPITVEIKDALPVLVLTLEPVDQTSCNGTPNGGINASFSVGGTATTTGYSLEWFVGTGSSLTPLTTGTRNNQAANNIAGATYYTVVATHAASGCQTTTSVYVPARDGIVTFDHIAYANTVCDPALTVPGVYTGRIEIPTIYFNSVADNANLANYTFTWWQEVNGAFVLMTGRTTKDLINVEPGRYQVEVLRADLACTTGRITLEIPNDTVDPQLALTVLTEQSACAPDYKGSLGATVSVNGTPVSDLGNYRFEWYRGTFVSSANAITTNLAGTNQDQALQLNTGYYTVKAINTLTGCVDIETIYLPERIVLPVTTLAVKHITGCEANEYGSVTATVMEGATEANYSNYTFRWYRGQSTTGTELTSTTGRLLEFLNDGVTPIPSGYYTVVAFNNDTRCPAPAQSTFLRAPIAVANDYEVNRRPSACNIDYGVTTVWVVNPDGTPNTTDYTFEWYKGRGLVPNTNYYTDPQIQFGGPALTLIPNTNPPYDFTTNINGTVYPTTNADNTQGPTAYGLESGVYTVVITDADGCKSLMEVDVAYEQAPESIVMRLEHVEDCQGSFGGVGVVAVDVNGVPFPDQSQYAFFLYYGANVTADSLINQNPVFGPALSTGETYFGMPDYSLKPGVYTMIAVDFYGNGCSSTSKTFEIFQIAQPPVVNAGSIVPSTMCEGGNGAATLNISNAEYRPGELDYALTSVDIAWTNWPGNDVGDNTYKPADITGALLILQNPLELDEKKQIRTLSSTFSNLAAGTYELTVTGNTGCFTKLTLVIPAAPVQPVVAATAVNQTFCQPVNGSIDITGVNGGSANQANYTFYLYNGQDNLANGVSMASGTIANIEALQLAAGTYYLVAVQNLNTGAGSGCSSAPLELRIRNVSVYPQISFVTSPNESCDANEVTGIVTATITTATGNFDYAWFKDGVAVAGGAGSITAGITPTTLSLTGQSAGMYRLEITAANGCPVWAEVQLGDYIQVPTIAEVTAVNQTVCDDAQADGSVTVQRITYAGTDYFAPFTGFTFTWSWTDENNVAQTATGSSMSGLLDNTYSVVVFKNSNPSKNCLAAPYTIDVEYEPVYPSITGIVSTPNEACDTNYTGAIAANVGFVGSYSYRLMLGTNEIVPATASTTAALNFPGLAPGVYTLEVTQINGCPVTSEITVGEELLMPVIMAGNIQAQTNCQLPGDGGLQVTSIYYNGAPATIGDFSYSWTGTDMDGNAFSGSGISLTGLRAGTYYVTATKNNTPPGSGCSSAPFELIVPYTPVFPSITGIVSTPNEACDTNYTGAIAANVGFVGSYSYRLLLGTNEIVPATVSTTAALNFPGLEPGVYTLEVTQINGCPVTSEITVGEELLMPVIMAGNIQAQTNCQLPGDGGLQVTSIYYNGAPATLSDFSYSWTGTDMDGNAFSGSGISLTGLRAGTYYVTATKNNTPPGSGCSSAPFELIVPYTPVFPSIGNIVSTPNEACDTNYTGAIAANVGFVGSYSYRLLLGTNEIVPATVSTTAALNFPGLEPGVYTLEVTQINGCPVTSEITVGEELLMPVIMAGNIQAQTNCQLPGDGGLQVTSIYYNGAPATLSDFSYSWTGTDMDGNAFSGSGISLTGLRAGTYYVTATKNNTPPGSGCSSAPFELIVPYTPVFPSIGNIVSTPNEACDTNYTGAIAANVGFVGSFNYTLTLGANTIASATGVNTAALNFPGLAPGVYTLEVTQINGCPVTSEITVGEELLMPVIMAGNIQAQTNCQLPGDGGLQVTSIYYNGAPATIGDFSYSWTGTDMDGNAFSGSGISLTGLRAGTYYVTATKNNTPPGSGCSSAPFELIVPYTPVFPSIGNIVSTPNEACDTNYTGAIAANVGFVGSYSYRLLLGTNEIVPATVSTTAALNFPGLAPGVYTLEVTQINGCPVTSEITVGEELLMPVIMAGNIQAQTNCQLPGDGGLQVTSIYYNGAPATIGDFSYSWTGTDMDGNAFSGSGISLTGLRAGTYYVTATKNNTPPGSGCSSAPFELIVPYTPVFPSIGNIVSTPNEACDTNYTGAIAANVGFVGSFNYTLTLGANTIASATGVNTAALNFPGLAPGVYTLEVTQINGCPVTSEITVGEELLMPVIMAGNIQAQTNCQLPGDGGLQVTSIYYNGAPATLSDFSYSWTGTDMDGNAFSGSGISLTGLRAGTYYVTATKNNTPPGSGCSSAPFELIVPYTPVFPSIGNIVSTPNEACDTNYTGAIAANVGFVGSYSYRLLLGTNEIVPATVSTTAALNFPGLAPGVYTLEVTQINGCPVTSEITVGEELLMPVIMAGNIQAQTNCQLPGDGGLQVTSIYYNGAPATIGDFSYSWTGTDMDGNAFSGSGISLTGLRAGTYYVTATKNNTPPGSGCSSAPFELIVPYTPVNATIDMAGTDNTSCLPTTGIGTITATLGGFGANYSYQLILNNAVISSGNAQTATTLTITDLMDGMYTLTVTAANGCPINGVYELQKSGVTGTIALTGADQSTCNADGSVTVSSITYGGQTYTADILANFQIVLIDAANNRTTATTSTTFSGLVAGNYIVEATKLSGAGMGCSITNMYGVGDVSTDPNIIVEEYNMISACFGSAKGLIGVSVDGTTDPSNYTVTWQFRQSITAALQPYAAGNGLFRITDLDPGLYTVNVRHNVTNCVQSLEFEITEVVVSLQISASANNRTFCAPENGELFVRVANEEDIRRALGYLPTFDFEVYKADLTAPTGSPFDRTSAATLYFKDAQSESVYTIFVWFNGYTAPSNCIGSDKVEIIFEDNRPVPSATVQTQLTVCPPFNGNATATANVNGVTDGYSFTWYAGEVDDKTNPLNQTGPTATNLGAGAYWVEVIDLVNGCPGTAAVEVEEYNPEIPFVEAMLVATAPTQCSPLNGNIEVIVGNREDFFFSWYRGKTAHSDSLIVENGPYILEGLDKGWYSVKATDKANGCISNVVFIEMPENYLFPEYMLEVTPSTCENDGSVRIINLSNETVTYKVYVGDVQINDPNKQEVLDLNRMIAGKYTLIATSPGGCDKREVFDVEDIVAPYNAVTANGDGQNDAFAFACISLYPENLVRIYNRAGALVFELSNYDNSLRAFTGQGNRGMYLGNKDLPAGTYYWVLFRNNVKEKPKTGFLELIR